MPMGLPQPISLVTTHDLPPTAALKPEPAEADEHGHGVRSPAASHALAMLTLVA